MIDTLKIRLANTLIQDSADLTIMPGHIEMKTGLNPESDLFVTESGTIIRGKKAFLNTDLYNLTILPKQTVTTDLELNRDITYLTPWSGYGHIQINENLNLKNNTRIYLQCSLPKINNFILDRKNYNLDPVPAEEIYNCIGFIFDDLNRRGIYSDFDNSEISRLDIFNQIKTDNQYKEYSTIFNQLNFSRKRNLNFGGDTFLYYNNSSELCIYDKSEELLRHKIEADKNLMRFENRFLTRRSYFNKFKTGSLQNLLNYPEYKKELLEVGNQIFDRSKLQTELIDENNLRLLLMQFKNKKRFWLQQFFYNEGILTVLDKVNKDVLLDILKDLLLKDKFYKIRKEINSLSFSRSIFNDTRSINLFDELKGKYFDNLNRVA